MQVQRPVPVPDDVSRFYWEATAAGKLRMQRCGTCDRFLHPPGIACPHCGSEDLVVTDLGGRGTVYSFAVVRQAFDPAFAGAIPYVVALVELDDAPGARLMTNLVDVDPGKITVGMPVEVTFEPVGPAALPLFRPC